MLLPHGSFCSKAGNGNYGYRLRCSYYVCSIYACQQAQDNEGMTALMYAVRNRRSASLIRLLIDKGADLEHRDKNGCTALFYAGSTEAQVLVANNANKEVSTQKTSKSRDFSP